MNLFGANMSEDNLTEQLKQFITSHGGGLVVNCESMYSMMYNMHGRLERLEAEIAGRDAAESQPDEKSSRLIEEQKAALELLSSGTELLSLSTSDRSGRVVDSEEGVSKSLVQDLVDKNQELKEEIYSLKKEVETLKNQLSQVMLSQQDHPVSVSERALHQIAGQTQSQVSREVEHVPETLEALTDVGELHEKHESLEARMERLEGERDDILDQLKLLKTQLVDAEMVDRKKVYEVEPLDMGPVNMSESSGLGEELAKSEATLSQSRDSFSGLEQLLHLQTADIRNAVQKLFEELQNMKQELLTIRLEQKRSPDNEMQDKLDSLQSKLDTVMASSSSMLSCRLQQEDQDSPSGKETAAKPGWLSAMADLSMKTNDLFRHFENLQSIVSGLMKQETSGRTFIADTTSELTSDVQGNVLQLQAGREKPQSTANPLKEHCMQEQSPTETSELTSDVQGTVLQLQAGREKLQHTASPLKEHRMQEQSPTETTVLTSDVKGTVLQLQTGREKLQITASPLREHHMQEQSHIETSELTSDVQGAVLQLQTGREKLQSTASPLKEHCMQEQSHIETSELTSDVKGTVLQPQAGREKLQSTASPLKEHRMQEQSNIETSELTSDVKGTVLQLQAGREKLHSIASPLKEHRMQEQSHTETSELTSYVQGAVLQLQAEFEKLRSTTTQLMKDHMQEQSHIEQLYKTMKGLDEKKADKKEVKIVKSIKADMQALDAKVLQCDTKTVVLNRTFQDLLTGHEDHCHKVIEKIFRELDCKLNYTELDPLKKQLEDCQMRIYKELQVQSAPESDDAAGLKKQLANFNCLSCDRPVDMNTPRPRLLVLPEFPSLPSPKDHRRMRTCTNLGQCESSPTEWSMEQTMIVRVSDSSGFNGHVYKTSEVSMPTIYPKEDDCKNKEMVSHSQLLQQPETQLVCHGSNCLETDKQWIIEESIPQTLQCRQPRKPDDNND